MSNTYTSIFFHCVWSTKNRYPFLVPPFDKNAYFFINNIIHAEGGHLIAIGGIPDHIHILVAIKPTESISRLIRCVKSESSKFIRQSHADLENFTWQRGYGCFSVSYSITESVNKYIQNQTTHHKNKSFDDEYLLLMKRHQIIYNEHYLFG